VRLPQGSIVKVEAEYDNSPDNPHNPSSPPRRVRWGEQTTDEMCLVGVQVTTDSLADLKKVVALNSARLGGALVGGLNESDVDGIAGAKTNGNVENDRAEALIDLVVANGFDIPAPARESLRAYDKDGDGRISKPEFDEIPSLIRQVIRETIRAKVNAAVGGSPR
jgi:hypothetical protein